MAEGSKAPTDGDVRRRRSHDYEDDIYGTIDGEDERRYTGTRTVSLDGGRPPTAADGGLHPAGPPAAASPGGNRASVENDRTVAGKKRKSDEIARDTTVPAQHVEVAQTFPTIDTNVANRRTGDRMEESNFRSTPHSNPSSPRSRTRGMSLRTALFTSNVNRRSQFGDSIIEMRDVPSSSQTSQASEADKKGSQAAVSVVPVNDEFESQTFDRTTDHRHTRLPSSRSARTSMKKGFQGLSALPNYQEWLQERANRHLPIVRAKQAYRKARKFLLRIREIPPSKDGRHIPLDAYRKELLVDDRTGHPFINNFIKSSKYTPWNFLPRQLFAQFSKLANVYFLIISILQMIPGLSTTGTYTTIIPLMAFVSISMAKEGWEDFRRHRLDKAENERKANILLASGLRETEADDQAADGLCWASVKWQSLRVGNIVKVERNEAIPADILLLHSSGTNNTAHIETMALDGETNLKPKQPSASLVEHCETLEAIASLKNTEVVVEDPNLDLYNFEGKVSIDSNLAPLTNNEIIYRGSALRNTEQIIGVIVYSGEECKIRMNANKHPRVKAPSLQATVNKIVVFMVFFVVLLSLFNSIAYEVWHFNYEVKAWYLDNARVAFGPVIISFIIMFNTMIPLSLYVSLEIIKVGQMFLMNTDLDMYDKASNTPFEARTSTINEELGQVSYIFSDKTGTLTENVMRFRKLSLAGIAWLHDTDLKAPIPDDAILHQKLRFKGKRPLWRSARKSTANDTRSPASPNSPANFDGLPRRSTATWRSAVPGVGQPELSTSDMTRHLQRYPRSMLSNEGAMMVLAMALCHTCLPERSVEDKISYQASSPDELALVQAAAELGLVVYEREMNTLTIKTLPNGPNAEAVFEKYEILDVIEFSSTRKRMSVLVRLPDGRICVICKGADSVITERLRLASTAHQQIAAIEQRANERRGAEAEEELRRRSETSDRRNSIARSPRTSLSFPRASSIGRISLSRMPSIRDGVSGSPTAIKGVYSPRPSGHFARHSAAYSDGVASPRAEADRDALVEDALARDESVVLARCFQHVHDFATEGLRTLLYGHRFLSEDEYREWKKVYHDATTSLSERQKKIEAAGELIEQQLELTGATAIEDKLQQGVPETIERLRRADIKLWMLTGDKRETAINIGHSCRLIKDYSVVTILDYEAGDVERRIAAAIVDINRASVAHSVIVIDGRTLAMIQGEESLHTLFLDLAILADSVICCRASPSQKAHLVHAVRRRVNRSVTLAIGDGANDIAMIQEAHVGIGITGKEGLQAARTSDYSIAQFRFLNKLLLVHGHWNYIRTCKYILATFWKEMLFYLTQAAYQRWNGYTGTSLYEQWSLSEFNTLFTSLPVIFLGIFEQDLAPATLIAVPELYRKGQRFAGFNFRVYLAWMFMAASEAMVVFFTVRALYGLAVFTQGQDLVSLGDLAFSVCIIVINAKIQLLEQRNRTVIAVACLVIELGGWFGWNVALSRTYSNNNEYDVRDGFLQRFGRDPVWWLCLVLAVVACLVYEMAVRAVKNAVAPTDVETFQQLERVRGVRSRLEEVSADELRAGWVGREGKDGAVLGDEAQAKRENEVQDLLDRPRVLEEGHEGVGLGLEGQGVRHSIEVHEILSRGAGSAA